MSAVRTCSAIPNLGQSLKHSAKTPTRVLPGILAHGSDTSTYSSLFDPRLPRGSWDSHMHVVDPGRFPLSTTAAYIPKTHTVDDAISFESSVGLTRIVLVQPSIYGNNNDCLLDALTRLGPGRARAVVSFDPSSTTQAQLKQWHDLGVRGVRFNVQSDARKVDTQQLQSELQQYADAVRSLDWVIEVYVPMRLMEALEAIIPSLDVRVCIDHMGSPSFATEAEAISQDPYKIPGFSALTRLLRNDRKAAFVKLSAPYRLGRANNHKNVETMARELIRVAGRHRLVFATDWPHTRFEGLDIRPWMKTVLDWCGDDHNLVERLFRDNAEELWNGP